MEINPLSVGGCYTVDLQPRGDDRGWFSRLFCQQEFAESGLDPRVCQVNNSLSRDTGTLRGLHYQEGSFAETKLVRAVGGAVFDVCLDLRPESPTYLKWDSAILTAENRRMIFIPRGCAHAILTLEPNTELIYLSSAPYHASSERGARWDDPAFGIAWPIEPTVISSKDASWPLWEPQR